MKIVCHQAVTYFKGQLILSSEEAITLSDSACAKPSVESMLGWGPGEVGKLQVGQGSSAAGNILSKTA